MVNKHWIIILILLCLTPLVTAQEDYSVSYAAIDFIADASEVEILDPSGQLMADPYEGQALEMGSSIRTGTSTMELSLQPNGTLVFVAENSSLTLDEFQTSTDTSTQVSVFFGELRLVAAQITGSDYTIRTPSALSGVRGTDFAIIAEPGVQDSIAVSEGEVEVYPFGNGESLRVSSGYVLDSLALNPRVEEFNDRFNGEPALLFAQRFPFAVGRPGDVPRSAMHGPDARSFNPMELDGEQEKLLQSYPWQDEAPQFYDAWQDAPKMDKRFDTWQWDEQQLGPDWKDKKLPPGQNIQDLARQAIQDRRDLRPPPPNQSPENGSPPGGNDARSDGSETREAPNPPSRRR